MDSEFVITDRLEYSWSNSHNQSNMAEQVADDSKYKYNTLYPTWNETELRERKWVKILNVDDVIYCKVLHCVIKDWLEGKIGDGQPTEQWEKIVIYHINDAVNKQVFINEEDSGVSVAELYKTTYKELLENNVLGHLAIVTSHRKWNRKALEFLELIGYDAAEQLREPVHGHDLSKYTYREVLGYSIVFGEKGNCKLGKLTADGDEEWKYALENHYATNPHHPEYYYPVDASGTSRDKSVSILQLDKENGRLFLKESLVDMLACRGERSLDCKEVFDVKSWLAIDDHYYNRYGTEDKEFVLEELQQIQDKAKTYISNEENCVKLKGFFDEEGKKQREVIWGFPATINAETESD